MNIMSLMYYLIKISNKSYLFIILIHKTFEVVYTYTTFLANKQ